MSERELALVDIRRAIYRHEYNPEALMAQIVALVAPPVGVSPQPDLSAAIAELACWRCNTAAYQPNERCDSHMSWRDRLQTEIEHHNAWRKRACEAEAASLSPVEPTPQDQP